MTGGLKRLGAPAAKPRRGKQSKAPAALPPPSVLTEEERQRAREAFDELTEASSALMDSGELDVYSKDKVPPRVSTSLLSVHLAVYHARPVCMKERRMHAAGYVQPSVVVL